VADRRMNPFASSKASPAAVSGSACVSHVGLKARPRAIALRYGGVAPIQAFHLCDRVFRRIENRSSESSPKRDAFAHARDGRVPQK
jgi:hypothetical protein